MSFKNGRLTQFLTHSVFGHSHHGTDTSRSAGRCGTSSAKKRFSQSASFFTPLTVQLLREKWTSSQVMDVQIFLDQYDFIKERVREPVIENATTEILSRSVRNMERDTIGGTHIFIVRPRLPRERRHVRTKRKDGFIVHSGVADIKILDFGTVNLEECTIPIIPIVKRNASEA
jgi:hypothetical protein